MGAGEDAWSHLVVVSAWVGVQITGMVSRLRKEMKPLWSLSEFSTQISVGFDE